MARPGIINKTKAVLVNIHAVVPLSTSPVDANAFDAAREKIPPPHNTLNFFTLIFPPVDLHVNSFVLDFSER